MSADEYNAMAASKKPSKYRNEKVTVDGHRFDSRAEGARYWDLRQLERAGEISDLELQPVYPLLVNGVKVGVYRADFRYLDHHGNNVVVEDVKGMPTAVYRLKKRMILAQYGIEIRETRA
jgi:hypothetical protein